MTMEQTLPKDIERVRALSLLFGPTGAESFVADEIEAELPSRCDSYVRDRMGNLIALIRCGDSAADKLRIIYLEYYTNVCYNRYENISI